MFLYLVRHGESEGNVLRTFHGWTDYPLTELGREQAGEVGEKLREAAFTRCVASPLRRAQDTALACIRGRNIVLETDEDLIEQNMGELEGLSRREVGERYPDVLAQFLADWGHAVPPGGDTMEGMLGRVGRAVDRIVARGEDTLIAAHNGSLSAAMVHLGVLTMEEASDGAHILGQGTYTQIEIGPDGRAKLLCMNR